MNLPLYDIPLAFSASSSYLAHPAGNAIAVSSCVLLPSIQFDMNLIREICCNRRSSRRPEDRGLKKGK